MSNYRKGRRFEYRVRDELTRRGYFVIRGAGSKPVDLVALKAGGRVVLVECKVDGRLDGSDLVRLRDIAFRSGALIVLARRRKRGIEFLDPWSGSQIVL